MEEGLELWVEACCVNEGCGLEAVVIAGGGEIPTKY